MVEFGCAKEYNKLIVRYLKVFIILKLGKALYKCKSFFSYLYKNLKTFEVTIKSAIFCDI